MFLLTRSSISSPCVASKRLQLVLTTFWLSSEWWTNLWSLTACTSEQQLAQLRYINNPIQSKSHTCHTSHRQQQNSTRRPKHETRNQVLQKLMRIGQRMIRVWTRVSRNPNPRNEHPPLQHGNWDLPRLATLINSEDHAIGNELCLSTHPSLQFMQPASFLQTQGNERVRKADKVLI
jgi:hypothetical protein